MTWSKEISTEWVELIDIASINEIPIKPKTNNFWMLTESIAICYSVNGQCWRFLLFTIGKIVRRSGEYFATKVQAKEFFDAGKLPTWVKGGID